jgi:hypothetical protein
MLFCNRLADRPRFIRDEKFLALKNPIYTKPVIPIPE